MSGKYYKFCNRYYKFYFLQVRCKKEGRTGKEEREIKEEGREAMRAQDEKER